MKFYRDLTVALLAVFALAANGPESQAQIIAGEDFDGGLSATSRTVWEGDFTDPLGILDTTYTAHDNTWNGMFDEGASSRFDRLGDVNPTILDGASDPINGSQEGLPFDMVDDTLNGFPTDRMGIQSGGVDDTGFGLADTLNGGNIDTSGLVSASWTFDISAGTNMQLSIDMAAIGDFDNDDGAFENDDFMTFTYSIDGGGSQAAFDVRPEADPNGRDAGTLYFVTMDDPNGQYDLFFDPFYAQLDWDFLIANGPVAGLTWHPDDLDMDGWITIDAAFGPANIRAYTNTPFDDQQLNAFKDPMVVNGTTQLDNNLQTVTTPIVGSGTELVLTLVARADGSLEYTVFDNILIEEVSSSADFDGNGIVDGLDFLQWQLGNTPQSGSQAELALWETQYGGPPPIAAAVSAVPEPASAVLLGIGLALVPFARRRRS